MKDALSLQWICQVHMFLMSPHEERLSAVPNIQNTDNLKPRVTTSFSVLVRKGDSSFKIASFRLW